MKEPTEQIGWIVTILLAIAALIANSLIPRRMAQTDGIFVGILFMALIAICGVLAMRYQGRGGPS